MTAKDWFNIIFALGTIALAAIASFYTHNRTKIDTKTATGKAIDTVGKLAVWAVREAEYTGMAGDQKREYAAEVITEQLHKKGITDITESTVYGAIQAAWSAANFDHVEKAEAKEPEAIQDAGDAGQVMDDAPVAAKEGEANGN
uniref:Holin n=1 Tax=Lactobacillus phage G2-Guo TaxID=3155564 RepID=A0AAU7PG84_9VIRU